MKFFPVVIYSNNPPSSLLTNVTMPVQLPILSSLSTTTTTAANTSSSSSSSMMIDKDVITVSSTLPSSSSSAVNHVIMHHQQQQQQQTFVFSVLSNVTCQRLSKCRIKETGLKVFFSVCLFVSGNVFKQTNIFGYLSC